MATFKSDKRSQSNQADKKIYVKSIKSYRHNKSYICSMEV